MDPPYERLQEYLGKLQWILELRLSQLYLDLAISKRIQKEDYWFYRSLISDRTNARSYL